MSQTARAEPPKTAPYPESIPGEGLDLRPWDRELIAQLAGWGERGFPFRAFDLGYLRDRKRAESTLRWAHEDGPHRHFIACEGTTAVGRISVNLLDDSGLYIWAIHVPPEHEGRGVARRMLAALMRWLEEAIPERDFVLTANAFSERAHRVYFELGFEIVETRWQHDASLSEELWKVEAALRDPLVGHFRFHNGTWEVRTFVMRRPQGPRRP